MSGLEIITLDVRPRFERQLDGTMMLVEPWVYEDVEGRLVLRPGFVTDFSSIPHRLEPLMPPWSKLVLSGLGHDGFYREPPFTRARRARGDRAWYRIARTETNTVYSASKGYYALRAFGWSAYGERNPHVKDNERLLERAARSQPLGAGL